MRKPYLGTKSPVRSKRGSVIGPAGQLMAMLFLLKSWKFSIFLHSIWKKLTRRKTMRRKRKTKRTRWQQQHQTWVTFWCMTWSGCLGGESYRVQFGEEFDTWVPAWKIKIKMKITPLGWTGSGTKSLTFTVRWAWPHWEWANIFLRSF